MRTTAARAFAGMAFAIGLSFVTAGAAAAQSAPSGPSGPGGSSTSTTSGSISPTTARPGGSGLARTGAESALPLAASAAAITVVLSGRRLAARLNG